MGHSKFGWSYPPGCSGPPDENVQCLICGKDADVCECPVCPVCGEQGNFVCYTTDHLKLNKGQLKAMAEMRIGELEERIVDERLYIEWLESQPEDYTESI